MASLWKGRIVRIYISPRLIIVIVNGFCLFVDENGRVSSPTNRPLNDSIMRPSVDSLLDELSNVNNSPIYATVNG